MAFAATHSTKPGTLGEKADDAVMAVGSGMKSMSASIRENTPSEGAAGTASALWSDALEGGGTYLERQGLSGIGEDVTNVIRRNPVPSVLIGIGLGFLVAHLVRK